MGGAPWHCRRMHHADVSTGGADKAGKAVSGMQLCLFGSCHSNSVDESPWVASVRTAGAEQPRIAVFVRRQS